MWLNAKERKRKRMCGTGAVVLPAGERAGQGGSGGVGGLWCWGAGVQTEEMRPGKHCENVTATLTAGQFSKSDAAGHFPLCVGTKSQGGSRGSWDQGLHPEGCFH